MQATFKTVAACLRVIDGDTILVRMVCPCCRIVSEQRVRLARLDAPELKGENMAAGMDSKEYLRSRIEGKAIEIRPTRSWPDKYGRVLAEVYYQGQCLTEEMVSRGHGRYHYTWKKGEKKHQEGPNEGAYSSMGDVGAGYLIV